MCRDKLKFLTLTWHRRKEKDSAGRRLKQNFISFVISYFWEEPPAENISD